MLAQCSVFLSARTVQIDVLQKGQNMSEEQQNLPYRYDRILIESDDILTPSFAGSTVVLSGAQIELLRNVVHYLDRRSTFVEEYNTLNYTTPDNDNWDDISQIVANLEEKLMGDLNVPWGFNERLTDVVFSTTMPAGDSSLNHTAVPAGEVWVVQYATVYTVSASCVRVVTTAIGSDGICPLAVNTPILTSTYYPTSLELSLSEGDLIYSRFYTMTLNDTAYSYLWGYKMKV